MFIFSIDEKTNQKNLGGFSFTWKLHKSLIVRMAKRCARPSSVSFLRLLFVLLRKRKISREHAKGLFLLNEYVDFYPAPPFSQREVDSLTEES